LLLVLAFCCSAQSADEQTSLQQALAEAGTSPVDFMRAIEGHLAKFPKTTRRPELERAIAKAALESDDSRRVVEYGERVLARESDDLKLMEGVARALLKTNDKPPSERALKYAQQYEKALNEVGKDKPERVSAAEWREQLDRGLGRSYALQARAHGNLGRMEQALALARRSFDTYPNAEAAREIGRWLSRTGREAEAVPHFADAFTIPDPRQTDADRAADRARLGELYRKLNGSEKGLGDLVLESYDRTTALIKQRRLQLKQLDPNAQLSNPMEFTLTGLQGDKLAMASLKGKVVVLDFWATWCGPCRVQHPLYEKVKQRFKGRSDVVFLSINTDETRGMVPDFVEENGWDKRIYFEDGLGAALRISSIPTTVLINKRGEIHSRMNGFIPERFVEMLSERIQQALAE
jgi:thiol-disulfide isomerase/thioredoxin